MLNEKRLYLIVSDYPYGNGEPFLEDELIALSKRFDKVYLIVTNSLHINNLEHKFSVPENVELKFYIPENNFLTRLRGLWFSFSEPAVSEELKIIKQSYKLPLSISTLRLLFSYVIHGVVFRNYLDKLINNDNSHKASNYIYSYWCTYYTFGLGLLKNDYKNIKAFTRVHRWDLYMNVHKPPYLPFRKFIIDQTDKTFSVSEDGKRYLEQTIPDINKDKISVNFLGTTINRLPNHTKPDNKLFVLSLAFISKVKQVDLLAEAISMIKDFDVEWHHIGGGGEEATYVGNLSEKLLSGKPNVSYKFHGNLSKKEIYDFLSNNNVHVLVNTSLSEGIPVSIMEAMSFGILVIATDVGGNREIVINKKNGILLNSNPTKEEIANALINIKQLSELDYKELCSSAYQTWNTKFNSTKNNETFIEEVLSLDSEMYKVCTRCILDNIDYPEINFDDHGVCNMCISYDEIAAKYFLSDDKKVKALHKLIAEIKIGGVNHEYDCVVGLSGGVDSSYVAYKTKELGLRPLVVHLDNGWNSELAVKNIENIVRKLGFDLYTHVINWNEFRDLQLSYFRASVVDIEALTDHSINAILYKTASERGIKYILSGENLVTEGRMPQNWVHLKNDLVNIKDIHRKFGKIAIKTFPTLGELKSFYYKRVKRIKTIPLLDYIDFNKNKAKQIIIDELEWRDYGGKHYESVFTRFYQSYILPVKFHADKRKSHYSTLICSGQLTRNEALELMKLPTYDTTKLKEDKDFVIKKLGLPESQFDIMMKEPIRKHTDFKSIICYYNIFISLKNMVKKLTH